MVVSKGEVYYPHQLPGFIAFQGDDKVGLATYSLDDGDCKLVTIHSLLERRGVGSALLRAVRSSAEEAKCKRLWLITTNGDLHAMDAVRKLKPMVPLIGKEGIPLRDEIELEMML